MAKHKKHHSNNLLVDSLQERAKELRCMYEFEELFKKYEDEPLDDFFKQVEQIIPPAFRFQNICKVKFFFDGIEYGYDSCDQNLLYLQSPIVVDEKQEGFIRVCYTESGGEFFFLPEEKKLINTIGRRIGRFVFYKRLRENIDVIKEVSGKKKPGVKSPVEDDGMVLWKWRNEKAAMIAEHVDPDFFGLKALYLIGSTKNGKTGPKSDIDLLAHCIEDDARQKLVKTWIDGYGKCLSYVYEEMTGIEIPGSIIDLHIITDKDIEKKTSFASMLSSVSNSAKLLKDYRK